MKYFYIIILVIFASCKKNITSTSVAPIGFSATSHQTMASYDTSGKPTNLEPARDTISTELNRYIDTLLPKKVDLRTTHPEFLKVGSNSDIDITQKSNVLVTFFRETAGNTNTIGYYTYPTGNPPLVAKDVKTIYYIFPNAGFGTTLVPGDKINIGSFDPGTTIGFVLLPQAWNSITKTINNQAVHFCTNSVLNPEKDPSLKQHAILIDYPSEKKVLISFEDFFRDDPACDHDFNDVIIYATIKP